MRGRRVPALSASPVLVGAVTLLVAIVAVFISYNANQGLPFVPTYDLKAQLANGYKLVKGNEVRAGGFRVGVVDEITSARTEVDGEQRSIAVLGLKLDKDIEPLPVDTTLTVRARSALGLKYVELSPGSSDESFDPGDTVPLANSEGETVDLEDVLASFPPEVRDAARTATTGFADALIGRGPAINTTIAELRPFLVRLEPVMRSLSAPSTELARLFPALARAVGEAAPVADTQAQWITDMATTFARPGQRPRGAAGHHRGDPADAGGRHPVAARADAVPGPLRRAEPASRARGGGAARLAAGHQRGARRRRAGLPRDPGAGRRPRGPLPCPRGSGRQPEQPARPPGPATRRWTSSPRR